MEQLPLFQPPFWTVSELTRYLRSLFEGDDTLQDVWVEGEVSNFSRPSSGHLYFTVKDASASLRCVMWRSTAARQKVLPRDGDAIQVHGSLNIYEAGGQYQLYADLIRPSGEGRLYQEFLRLKERLEAEGLFAPERKRPIPPLPRCIGIVTSPTGAALRDILNTLRRRYPLARVALAPAPVQGAEAPPAIIAAFQALNRLVHPDVILLARGGGSIEDLWAFNDENVARAIAASVAPVITGVGHETDFTIADFVSDLRAPTPTAAAELAVPNRGDLLSELDDLQRGLLSTAQRAIANRRWGLDSLAGRLGARSPIWRLRSDQQRLDELVHHSVRALQHSLQLKRVRLSGSELHLSSLNPVAILQRGYAIVNRPDGGVVRSVSEVAVSDRLYVRLVDGRFTVRVAQEDEG
jgi:exodeoxyribonuclease VII large subunit